MTVVDAGMKAVSMDSGVPLVSDSGGSGMKAVSMDSGVPLVSDSGGCWDEGSQHGLWCTFGK